DRHGGQSLLSPQRQKHSDPPLSAAYTRSPRGVGQGASMQAFQQPSPPWWIVQRGDDPIIAIAIHDGHGLGAQAAAAMALDDAGRLREEDPHTWQAILDIPTHVIAMRSRFEADLN